MLIRTVLIQADCRPEKIMFIEVVLQYSTVGWSVDIFFWSARTGQLTKVQVWFKKSKFKFSAHERQSFHFKKIPGGQNINIFWWKFPWSFFYIKEQTQKYKCEIWLLKSTILDPRKSAFLVFEENPPKMIFLRVSALIQL